jgi:hypothetical protein
MKFTRARYGLSSGGCRLTRVAKEITLLYRQTFSFFPSFALSLLVCLSASSARPCRSTGPRTAPRAPPATPRRDGYVRRPRAPGDKQTDPAGQHQGEASGLGGEGGVDMRRGCPWPHRARSHRQMPRPRLCGLSLAGVRGRRWRGRASGRGRCSRGCGSRQMPPAWRLSLLRQFKLTFAPAR